MNKDSIGNTFFVIIALCLACSALVSLAAVGLKPYQEKNKALDKKKNILVVAELFEPGVDVDQVFKTRIDDRVIDLETGRDVTGEYPDGPGSYDSDAALEQEGAHVKLDPKADKAVLKKRENRAHVYVIKTSESDPTPQMYVLPIRGKGLWSTLKGFLALDVDLRTVRGITYYEHAETPGLGGEVDNPEWKAKWPGKIAINEGGDVVLRVLKVASTESHVDALSGATITSNGVQYMIEFWLGPNGFGPYFDNIRQAEAQANGLPSQPGDHHG